jgi:hypothetical protein
VVDAIDPAQVEQDELRTRFTLRDNPRDRFEAREVELALQFEHGCRQAVAEEIRIHARPNAIGISCAVGDLPNGELERDSHRVVLLGRDLSATFDGWRPGAGLP